MLVLEEVLVLVEVVLVRVVVVLVGVKDRDLIPDVEPDLFTELFVLTVGLR
jgi:hypothetical protein